MIFDMTAKKLIGVDVARARELRKNYESFFQGLIAFPLYVPGTTFYRCMQVYVYGSNLNKRCDCNVSSYINLVYPFRVGGGGLGGG